ncbi:MAG: sigma factor [Nocardioidaceae bacterium]
MTRCEEHRRDGPTADEAGFREWMAVRAAPLRRKAFLMSGDWRAADDLVQDMLISVYASWSRIARSRNADAYANCVLVHKFIDDRRRPWRRERVVDAVSESVDERAMRAFADVYSRDASADPRAERWDSSAHTGHYPSSRCARWHS